jgi:thiol-disulfide isomerase/thioredoxin
MNAKQSLTLALLLFVAISLGVIVAKESREASSASPTVVTPADAVNHELPMAKDGVSVYYFHGNTRCPTCRGIEATVQEAVTEGFVDELASGQVVWLTANYDQPENAHFLDDYQLVTSTPVVVLRRGGEQVEWQKLDSAWELASDQAALGAYVQEVVASYLPEGTDE